MDHLRSDGDDEPRWYAVRHFVRDVDSYEERVTVWRCDSFDEAFKLAESEALEYLALWNEGTDVELLDTFQGFELGEPPDHGREVFSLIRHSGLNKDEYVRRFFESGDELTSFRARPGTRATRGSSPDPRPSPRTP